MEKASKTNWISKGRFILQRLEEILIDGGNIFAKTQGWRIGRPGGCRKYLESRLNKSWIEEDGQWGGRGGG